MYRRPSFRLAVLTLFLGALTTATCEKSDANKFATVQNSNEAILQRLGLAPLRIPDGHHKKRLSGPEPLASQTRIHQPYSRRHGHRDSHVYVVKLPPSQPYYALTKPHKTQSLAQKDNDISAAISKKTNSGNSSPQVGFQSNGKPGKIYHWNLPLVKKINEKKRLYSQLKFEQMRKRVEEEMNDQQSPSHENHGGNKNRTTYDTTIKTSSPNPSKKTSDHDKSSAKRNHHSTSVNSLNEHEKPVKHTRNNDKRLNYPRIPEQLAKSGRPEIKNGKHSREDNEDESKNNNDKKMYRLEDSNLYRLESRYNNNQRHKNDRLAVWSLSNDLRASDNTQNSLRLKKHRKKAAMSYYAPINSRNNVIDPNAATKIQKNFPGNGKPKAFYVMEKSRQPIYYHPLLP